jgi:hypothetical protein
MVLCNPRDREAAHRAEVEDTGTVVPDTVVVSIFYLLQPPTKPFGLRSRVQIRSPLALPNTLSSLIPIPTIADSVLVDPRRQQDRGRGRPPLRLGQPAAHAPAAARATARRTRPRTAPPAGPGDRRPATPAGSRPGAGRPVPGSTAGPSTRSPRECPFPPNRPTAGRTLDDAGRPIPVPVPAKYPRPPARSTLGTGPGCRPPVGGSAHCDPSSVPRRPLQMPPASLIRPNNSFA